MPLNRSRKSALRTIPGMVMLESGYQRPQARPSDAAHTSGNLFGAGHVLESRMVQYEGPNRNSKGSMGAAGKPARSDGGALDRGDGRTGFGALATGRGRARRFEPPVARAARLKC